MSLLEYEATFLFWKETVKRLKMVPNSKECQYMAMVANMQCVCVEALYWQARRP